MAPGPRCGLRGAPRAGRGARLAVVGGGRARARALRPGLPALHRAAGDDLGHDLAAGVAAAAGVLDELHRRRLHGHAALLPGRRGRLPRARAGHPRDPGAARAVPRLVRLDAARALRALLPRAGARRPARDVRRLPGGRAAAPRGDLHLQPRAGGPLPAHDLQGGAARRRSGSRASARSPCRRCGGACASLPSPSARRSWRSRAGRWRAGSGSTASSACPTACRAAWHDAARDLDRSLPRGERAMVLPGQLFAFYDWGGTYDPILPALTDRPVAVRFIVPFADLRAVDLQWTTDALVSQERALPGQLGPLLDLMGVGAVLQGADDDRARSGAVPASSAAGVLGALGPPDRSYGPSRTVPGAAGTLDPPARLPQVRRWDVRTRGMVRVLPRAGATVVDGSAPAIADLAAFGALRTDRALRYAGDLDAAALREQAARGASFVISDSNRRRAFVAARLRGNTGWTLPADEQLSEDAAQLDPFPARGTDAQTVARIGGIASVRADFSPGFAQFPERRPFAALDGDTSTAWLADRALATDRHHLDVAFTAPRDVDHVDLMPYSDGQGRVDRVAVNGREFAVDDGWNRLPVNLHGVRSLSVRIAHVVQPPDRRGRRRRHPRAAHPRRARERGAAPAACSSSTRCTAPTCAAPGSPTSSIAPPATTRCRPRVVTGARSRGLVRDQQDGERGWARAIAPPAARAWRADAWASVAPETPDRVLDPWVGGDGLGDVRRLLALRGARAQPRLVGLRRRSAARVDRGLDPLARRVAAVARRGRPRTIRSLRLERAPVRVRFPTRVRVIADGRPTAPLAVAADGAVALPAPLRARTRAHRGPRRRLRARRRPASHASAARWASGRSPATASRAPPSAAAAAPAPALRRGPDAQARHARGAPARGRDAGGDRRRPPAVRRRLRARGRAPRRAADRPCRPGAVAPGPRAAHVGGAREHAGRRRRPGARPRPRRRAARATASASPSTGRAGSCSASPTTPAGARAATGARWAGRSPCRATPTAGPSSAAAATCPSPSRPTARCWQRRDLARRLPGPARPARAAPPARGAAPRWRRCPTCRRAPGRCAARSRPASPPGSSSASSSRCAPAPSWAR